MKKKLDLFSLRGKTALVTGGTGYLGSSMSMILAEAGAEVLINSRLQDRSDVLVKEIEKRGLLARSAAFDINDNFEVDAFIASLGGRNVDILINNAYSGGAGSVENSTQDDYLHSYEMSILSTHYLFTSLLPNLRGAVKENDDASVINIGSMYGLVSPDQRIYESMKEVNPPFYGVAKAALLQWTKYAACEFGVENIRVNSISPGPFPNDRTRSEKPNLIKKLNEKVPMGRVGVSDEIKGPTLFLASKASSFVNGSNLIVDGGWTCW